MVLEGKKLLILAGQGVHCKVVRAAKELGIYTVVADYLQDSPAKEIADESLLLSITDVEAIAEYCRKNSIDGVLNYCNDLAQIPYQRICEAIGKPCYGTRKQFNILTNKKKFKMYCQMHGLDVVPEYSWDGFEGFDCFPVLVKPTDSRGSRGQTICWKIDELKGAVEKAREESRDHGVIIERYMGGKQDFSLVYLVIDSEPYLMKAGDRYLGRSADNLDRQQICSLFPARKVDEYIKETEPKVRHFIRSLGISFGPVFLQGFLEDGKVYLYDPGMRFPGSDYDLTVIRSTGFDPIKSMIRFSLTGDVTSCEGNPRDAFRLNGKTSMILSISTRPGTIARMSGFDAIQSDPRICSFIQNYSEGETVPDSGDFKQRVAELVGLFDNREEAKKFAVGLYDKIRIEDEKGDMIVSKMGIDIPF